MELLLILIYVSICLAVWRRRRRQIFFARTEREYSAHGWTSTRMKSRPFASTRCIPLFGN
jgi:hypothetical protein